MSWDPVSMAVGMAIGIAFVLFVLGVSHWAAEQLATSLNQADHKKRTVRELLEEKARPVKWTE